MIDKYDNIHKYKDNKDGNIHKSEAQEIELSDKYAVVVLTIVFSCMGWNTTIVGEGMFLMWAPRPGIRYTIQHQLSDSIPNQLYSDLVG